MDYINGIINILHEEGIDVNYSGEDLDLRFFIIDSIQFISFVVDVEKTFEIEIPDELLLYESISSLFSFAELIKCCKEESINAHND